MALLLAVIIGLVPLAIAPGLFFYFDVTPKTVVLLLGTGAALIVWLASGVGFGLYRASRTGRWFTIVLAGMAASLTISTLLSTSPVHSLGGSNWRNWGLVTHLAVLFLTYLVALCCAGRPDRLRLMLRATAIIGTSIALYGIAQYFGWDPFQDARSYHAGEGIWTIVRPPSTLGHADYFGIWLLAPVFAGVALTKIETGIIVRRLGWLAVALCTAALVLSGTRSAMLGFLTGAVALFGLRAVRLSRGLATAFGIAAVVAAGFYASPAGEKLRARVHWSSEDTAGGARLLLWRDTLRMSVRHLPVGYGPETYIANFARWQSPDLSRAYPDFYHESPHNIALDALVSQGLPGFLLLVALCAVGFASMLEIRRSARDPGTNAAAGFLVAGLVAMTIAGQFASFMLPTALAYYTVVGALVALTVKIPLNGRSVSRWIYTVPVLTFAALFIAFGARLFIAENALAEVKSNLDRGSVTDAANEYERYEAWRLPGASADLWYSRRLIQVAQSQMALMVRMQALQQAKTAAERGLSTAEDPFNAYYNAAEFHARQNDFVSTEDSLKQAIACAPNWFKPHWMLAQVLEVARRLPEAQTEAARAVYLDGNKHIEVRQTAERIHNSLGTVPLQTPEK
ncbi:MAG: O-antigen ligase family protein [Bryobacteraceae bacterium]